MDGDYFLAEVGKSCDFEEGKCSKPSNSGKKNEKNVRKETEVKLGQQI
jgi:hypothetical protein